MKDMPESERPYEKCFQQGPSYLSDAELLAVLLRTGSIGESALDLARRILYDPEASPDTGLQRISCGSMKIWMHLKGVGPVKAAQILCLAELAKRLTRSAKGSRVTFSAPGLIADHYMESMRHLSQETVKAVFLDSKARKMGECDISKGTVSSSLISPREVFMEAVRHDAVFLVLLHNHPSGDTTPSQEDINITERLEYAGKMLGIPLLDHIVIGDRCYFSFQEHGLLVRMAEEQTGV